MSETIERSKFIVDLLAEVDAFDENLFPCNYKGEEGDTPVGELSPWLRKLYSLMRYYHRQCKLLAVEKEYTKPSECAEDCDMCETRFKYSLLNEMLFASARSELRLWSEPSVGIRQNWQVVRAKPEEDDDGFKKFILGLMRGK